MWLASAAVTPVTLAAGLLGVLSGPLIHHLAVQAGADASFAPREAICSRCNDRLRSIIGRCSDCGSLRGRVYGTSVATGVVAAGVAAEIGPRWILVAYLGFVGMSMVLFLTDVDHKRIPNRITYPGTPVAAVLLALGAIADGLLWAMPRALLGAAVYAGVLLVVFVAARGGFGFGDVKLAVVLGIFLVFLGWDRLLLAGFATAILGGLAAVAALVSGRAGRSTEIPYGPPMIVGAWLAIIAGPTLSALVL